MPHTTGPTGIGARFTGRGEARWRDRATAAGTHCLQVLALVRDNDPGFQIVNPTISMSPGDPLRAHHRRKRAVGAVRWPERAEGLGIQSAAHTDSEEQAHHSGVVLRRTVEGGHHSVRQVHHPTNTHLLLDW